MLTLPMKPTEWAGILNSVLLQREIEILGVVDDGTNWNIRYRAAVSAPWVQIHVQSSASGEGGETYDASNYTSTTEVDCRAELVQDLALTLLTGDTYTVFFIPVQYDGAGTKVLYDGVSAEDRMVFWSQSLTNLVVSGRAYFTSTDDVDLDGVSGAIIIGGDGTGQHIAIDGNEIHSKSDGTTAATILINDLGGDVRLGTGAGGATVDIGNGLYPRTNGALQLGVTSNRWGAAWMGALTATTGTFSGAVNTTEYYEVDGTQVVGNQGAAVADATDAASAITQLNALLARARAHGWIAT